MDDVSERDLIARCRRGDSRAWEELFQRHYDAMGRFVFQLAPDFTREDVEEVCQDTLVTVVRTLDGFRGASAFQTWLFRIAANKANDYREKTHAAKRGGGRVPLSLQAEDPVTGLTLDPPSEAPSPDESLLGAEQAAELHGALDRLGNPCRELIELRYFGDRSYEELSSALDLNIKTVSSRLSKCLDKLEALVRSLAAGETSGRFPV